MMAKTEENQNDQLTDKDPEFYENWDDAWEKLDMYSMRRIGCPICRHYNQNTGGECAAYPFINSDGSYGGGIPAPIHDGRIIHTQALPGDHGKQFEPLSKTERAALPKRDF